MTTNYREQIAKLLLITLILSLGFGQLLRFDLFDLPLYLHDVIVICILLLQGQALQVKLSNLEGLALTGFKIFLLGLALGWLRAFTLYSLSTLLIPSLYTFRLLAYLALYLLIKDSKILVSKFYFLTSGSIALIIGLGQYFLMSDMRVFQYLGWDDHLSRLTLPHFDPTFTAVMLGLALMTIPLKSWFVSLLLSFGILLTYSRSVWLSLTLTFAFFMIKNKKILYLIIGICLLLIPISLLPKRFGEGTNLLRTYSITSRAQSDLSYVQKYKWDILIGRGLNTLTLDMSTTDRTNHATGPNNSYLYLLLTSGVLGLTGWGVFMLTLYRRSAYKPMLIFFFIASFFNNVMFYPFTLLWILLTESNSKNL